MIEPISTAVIGKAVVVGVGTTVLITLLISQLRESRGQARFQELPTKEQVALVKILSKTSSGRAFLDQHADVLFARASSPTEIAGDVLMATQFIIQGLS